MKSKIWLLISGALLISTHLQADENDYSNRQFNVNPGNMMDGMFNPMRSFFGGSNRYSDDYSNYRYAPPPAYQPGYGYSYPAAPYGYPPVNPSYQPMPRAGGYPSNIPAQQTPTAASRAQPPQAPASSSHTPATSGQPTYSEHFRFRPLDTGAQPTQRTEISMPSAQQPAALLNYPPTQQPSNQTTATQGIQIPTESQTGQLKFRPLDKPGYSE
jgi:hypothetical protein